MCSVITGVILLGIHTHYGWLIIKTILYLLILGTSILIFAALVICISKNNPCRFGSYRADDHIVYRDEYPLAPDYINNNGYDFQPVFVAEQNQNNGANDIENPIEMNRNMPPMPIIEQDINPPPESPKLEKILQDGAVQLVPNVDLLPSDQNSRIPESKI